MNLSHLILPRLILPYPILSYLILSYLNLSHLISSHLILSYPILCPHISYHINSYHLTLSCLIIFISNNFVRIFLVSVPLITLMPQRDLKILYGITHHGMLTQDPSNYPQVTFLFFFNFFENLTRRYLIKKFKIKN